jgi:hypothetical protein
MVRPGGDVRSDVGGTEWMGLLENKLKFVRSI